MQTRKFLNYRMRINMKLGAHQANKHCYNEIFNMLFPELQFLCVKGYLLLWSTSFSESFWNFFTCACFSKNAEVELPCFSSDLVLEKQTREHNLLFNLHCSFLMSTVSASTSKVLHLFPLNIAHSFLPHF